MINHSPKVNQSLSQSISLSDSVKSFIQFDPEQTIISTSNHAPELLTCFMNIFTLARKRLLAGEICHSEAGFAQLAVKFVWMTQSVAFSSYTSLITTENGGISRALLVFGVVLTWIGNGCCPKYLSSR